MSPSRAVAPLGTSKPIGVYSPAVLAPQADGASLLFISGQVPVTPEGVVLHPEDAVRQADAVFDRIELLLEAGGGSLGHLVSVVLYLTRREDFESVSAVRNRRLSGCEVPPASTAVFVAGLVEPGVLLEISGVAVMTGRPVP